MAYDEVLAQRIRTAMAGDAAVTEKKMFGGIAFLRHGLMFAGVTSNSALAELPLRAARSGTSAGERPGVLMARVGKADYADSLSRKHVREMDFTGRPMQGYVYVDPEGIRTEAQLRFWLDRCTIFVSTLPPKARN
jgi:hypothetical protein